MSELPPLRRMGFEPDDRPRSPRRLPRLLLETAALVWRAAPRLVLVVLQVVAAIGFGAILARRLFELFTLQAQAYRAEGGDARGR